MDTTGSTLDALGIQFGTDKSSKHHGYLDIYEQYFIKYRNQPIKLLEIGVLNGASLKTWEAYFPYASILGADINPVVRQYQAGRVSIAILDQSNVQNLVDVAVQHGPFDIVIEDGSHLWEHQITTLRTLFPFVKPSGLYIVEDLQTNFGSLSPQYKGNSSISCVEYLKKLIDYRVGDEQVDINTEEDSFIRSYGRSLATITFCRHACILQKNPSVAARFTKLVGQPIVDFIGDNPLGLRINAHVGKIADVFSDVHCCVNVPEALGGYIQGFEIITSVKVAESVSLRVRSPNGTWSPWTGANTFAGTRGQGKNLTGFAVKIIGDLALRYSVKITGQFKGCFAHAVGNGEDCVGDNGTEPLLGVQIDLFEPITLPA